MPFLDAGFIRYMVKRLATEQVLIPRAGDWVEPLHAIYAQSCLPEIEANLRQNICKIQSFFPKVRVGYLDVEEYGHSLNCFTNINSQADLTAAETVYFKSNK